MTFLIGPEGRIKKIWPEVKPAECAVQALAVIYKDFSSRQKIELLPRSEPRVGEFFLPFFAATMAKEVAIIQLPVIWQGLWLYLHG